MGDMDYRVIPDVLDVLGIPQESYAESFGALSLFLAEKCDKNLTDWQTDGQTLMKYIYRFLQIFVLFSISVPFGTTVTVSF